MASTSKKTLWIVIKRLLRAYPEKKPDAALVSLYLESLSDIPPWLVRRAAEQHIRRSVWFPKVAELRSLALELAGLAADAGPLPLAGLPPHPCSWLTARAVELEEAFHSRGRLEPAEWESLAAQLGRADRPHRAARTLEKLAQIQAVMDEFVGTTAPVR